jgi:invasion protein IalB
MIGKAALSVLMVLALAPAVQAQRKVLPEKTSPRPVQPAPKTTPPEAAAATTPFVYTPWVKFCGQDKVDPAASETCLTLKEARLDSGQFVAGAAVIERKGADKKLLRVTLPLGMQLMPGVRVFIDDKPPAVRPYVLCIANGCMADFEVNAEFIATLKTGRQLQLQGVNLPGQVASYLLPLGDFAQAFEGPPTDPEKFRREQGLQRDERLRNPSQPK